MIKRTYQPSNRRRVRKVGFRARLRKSSLATRFNLLKRRRDKGRHKLVTL